MLPGTRRSCRRFSRYVLAAAVLAASAFSASPARADLILGAEARLTYEDNVVGLLSDAHGASGKPGGGGMMAPGMGNGKGQYTGSSSGSASDWSLTFSGEAGGITDVGSRASLFAKGFAEHTSYDTYTDFDATIAGIAAGVNLYPSDSVSTRLSLIGKIKRYGDSQRDATAFGGSASVKERIGRPFWLREYLQVEKNDADNSAFSYRGYAVGIEGGYDITKKTSCYAGASYGYQDYDDPASPNLTIETLSFGMDHRLSRTWSLGANLDVQTSDAGGGSTATDDILSFAVRYDY